MRDAPRLLYTPLHDAGPKGELSALAHIYRFILDASAKKNPAAGPSERGNHDGTTKEASADATIIPDVS